MSPRAPTPARGLLVVALAVSSLALLVALWTTFGDAAPSRADGYRLHVPFADPARLVAGADVRISGVPVGEVRSVTADRGRGGSDVVLVIEPRFAPIPADTRATLRTTTLLGETSVELSPGSARGAKIPDGGTLAAGRVGDAVDLADALRTLDGRTRRELQDAIQGSASALRGQGADLAAAIGTLSPVTRDGGTLLEVLGDHDEAVRRLVRDGGATVGALSARRGELSGLIGDANRLLALTDRRASGLHDAVAAAAPFQRQARRTIERVSRFQRQADPLLARLAPVARELPPTLGALGRPASDARALLTDLGPLVGASRAGLPALGRTADALRPALQQLEPLLRETNPALAFVARYPGETRAFFPNAAAALQASAPGVDGTRHRYLRVVTPINLESLAGQRRRTPTNRPSAYAQPGSSSGLADGLPVLEGRQCGRATVDVRGLGALLPLLGPSVSPSAAPPCVQQERFVGADGRRTDVPKVPADR